MADTAELIEAPQNEVAVQEGQTFDLASPEGLMGALLSAAPGTDTDKLDALASIYERMEGGRARQSFARAMAEMQPKLPAVGKGGENKHLNSNYARLEDVQGAIKTLLAEHGFSYRWVCETGENEINVTCIVTHKEGHSEQDTLPLPIIEQKGTNRLQQHGITVSYGKRYTLCNVLGIQLGGEDTDGNVPKAPTKAGSRELYADMQKELRECMNLEALQEWDAECQKKGLYEQLPGDWFENLREEFLTRKESFS